MVCNVSLGKKGLEEAESELLAIRTESEGLRLKLTGMVEEDIAAFDSLMAAYKLPKSTESDKAGRSAAIQEALRRATEVPLECARACAAVIALARRSAERGYRGVISDAGVGVAAAHGALRSAALNVFINAPALIDRAFAQQALAEVEALMAAGTIENDAVYALVRSRLG